MEDIYLKKPLKIAIIAAPYVLLALYGLFSLGLYFFEKAHEDTIVPLLVNRGNSFEMHYDNSGPSKHFLWVNGHPIVRTSPAEGEEADEFIKEYVMSFSPDNESYTSLISYVINDDAIIYKTSDMERFEILGYMRLNDVHLSCKDLLEDMGCIISREYPIHAVPIGESGAAAAEPRDAFGIFEGFGYRIEALTNGTLTEWQFYIKVYDADNYVRDEKIFSMRWRQ